MPKDANAPAVAVSENKPAAAAASPAVTTPAAPAVVDEQAILDGMTAKELQTWRMTGKLPSEQVSTKKSGDSSSSAKPGEAESGEESANADDSEEPAASEAASRQGTKRKGAKERTAQLHTEIAELESRLARRAELRRQIDGDGQTDGKAGESSTTQPAKKTEAPPFKETRPKPTINDAKPDGTPKFANYEEFNEDLVDWKMEQKDAKATFEKEQAEKTAEAERVEKLANQMKEDFTGRIQTAQKKYADFDDMLKVPELRTIPTNSPLDRAIMLREAGPEILYHLAKNPQEIARLVKLDALAQAVEIGKLEARLVPESDSGDGEETKRGPDGKFLPANTSEKPVTKKVSTAPKPAAEVAGRGTPPEDEVEAAVAANDTKAYNEAMNRREIARRQGR